MTDLMADLLADITADRGPWSTASLVMNAEAVPPDTATGWIVRLPTEHPPQVACEHLAAMVARSDNPDTWHLRAWYVPLTAPEWVLCSACAVDRLRLETAANVCAYCEHRITGGGSFSYHNLGGDGCSITRFGYLCGTCRRRERRGLPGLLTVAYGPSNEWPT